MKVHLIIEEHELDMGDIDTEAYWVLNSIKSKLEDEGVEITAYEIVRDD